MYPDPFTTLAWRLWHLTDMYGENRAQRLLDVPPQGEPVGPDAPDPTPPGTAPDALDQLDRAHAPMSADALTERAIRGNHSLLVDIESVDPETASALLSTAASFGRWALVEEMIVTMDTWPWGCRRRMLAGGIPFGTSGSHPRSSQDTGKEGSQPWHSPSVSSSWP